jgi:hypothetical protein
MVPSPGRSPNWMRRATFSRLVLAGRAAQEVGDMIVLGHLGALSTGSRPGANGVGLSAERANEAPHEPARLKGPISCSLAQARSEPAHRGEQQVSSSGCCVVFHPGAGIRIKALFARRLDC